MKNTLFRISKRLAIIAVAFVLAFGPGRALAQRPLGVDVSNNNGGGINWGAVKGAGFSYAWAKATEGVNFIDADFTQNENNGKGAGLYMGGYDFSHPNLNAPGSEASYFWGEAGGYITGDGKSLMPTLDFETFSGVIGASSYSDWANQWCNSIAYDAAAAGNTVKPVIYTTTCEACNFNSSVAAWNPWIANPNGQNSQTGTPWTACTSCDVWGGWDVWQYYWPGSSGGTVSYMDQDVFDGNSAQMVSTLVVTAKVTANCSSFVGPIAMNANGTLEMFGVGNNNDVWHDYESSANGGWVGWYDIGAPNSRPGAVVNKNKNGLLQVFVVDNSTATVWTDWQTSPGTWSGWANFGGSGITNLVAATNSDGRMEVFGIASYGDVWHTWQTAANGGWSPWYDLAPGHQTKAGFVVSANQNGAFQLFGVGTNGDVWTDWQTSPGGNWSGWADFGAPGMNPRLAFALNLNGCLEIFGIGSNNDVWHTWQTSPNSSWTPWYDFGAPAGIKPGFVAGINKNGAVQLFGVGSNGHVWTDWQTVPGASWSGWNDFGAPGTDPQLVVGNAANGALQVFGIGSNTDVWQTWQTSPNGSWSGWYDDGAPGTKYYYGQP